jgi:PTH1 family peptidyl-tRNA hydrolase
MVIFGLGNPGLKYRWTRHNAGFLFIEYLAKRYKKRFQGPPEYKQALIRVQNKEVRLIKPFLYMNRSGLVVERILKENPDDFIVVLDDINLPLGRMRFRAKGSDGGHLGLRSIIEAIKTEEFPRLRIGIGNQEILGHRVDSAEFVLKPFERREREVIKKVIEKGIEGIEIFIIHGFERAQNFINSVRFTP